MRNAPKRHSKPRLILFDLDGTLAESLEAGLNAMNLLRFLFGYKKLDPTDPRLRLVSGMNFVKEVLGLNVVQLIVWAKLLKFLVTRQAPTIRVYKGWKTVLTKLKKRFTLGVVTSAPRVYAETILENGGLAPFFDFVTTDVKYHRKDASLKRILAERKLKATDVLYIGDEVRDLAACAKHGIPFAAVDWGKDHGDLFADQKKSPLQGVLKRPTDLLKML